MGHEARQTNFIQICSQARSARLQPPPTLTAPLPAAAPDNPSTCDPTRTNTDLSQYPTAAVIRRPLNRWRPPPNFQALSPTDQLLDWFEFHANQLAPPTDLFFFHEYGRRVGMVPRSSLKEGKYSQMVEKRTKTTTQQTTKKQNKPQPKGRASTIL